MSDAGLRVVITDTNWSNIRKARMNGLSVWYGSAVSGYADANLDLTGIGNLLAVSRRAGLNELACVRYAREFGRDHVYTLADAATARHEKHKVSGEQVGRILFDGEILLRDLVVEITRGAGLKTTTLTDEFDFDDYKKEYPDAKVIFAIDPDEKIHFRVSDAPLEPKAGWSVTSLL